MKINRQLLAKVLDSTYTPKLTLLEINDLVIFGHNYIKHINVYVLINKYKLWALRCPNPYILEVRLHSDCCTVNVEFNGTYVNVFQFDTEFESIVKACEWIDTVR